MKKRLYPLIIIPCLLSGCAFLNRPAFDMTTLMNDTQYTSIKSKRFEEYDLSFDIASFRDYMKTLNSLVEEKTSLDREFVLAFNKVFNTTYNLRDKIQVAMTKYNAGGEEQENYKNIRYELNDYFNEFLLWMPGFLTKIYHSSESIKNAIFGDMTDKEIEQMIDSYRYDENIANLKKQLSNYEDQAADLYNQLGMNRECALEMMKIYVDYIKVGNELASYYDYDNYLSYVYKNTYNRDFDKEKYDLAFTYYKQYLLPVYGQYQFRTEEYDKAAYSRLTTYNMFNKDLFLAGTFQRYASWMGGSYSLAYNHLFYDGLYCFTDEENAHGTAYIASMTSAKDGLAFFTGKNQDINTLIHEFGHYHANYANSDHNSNASFDILETHSQANEYIFCNYLENEYKDQQYESTIQYYVDYKLKRSISYIANMSVVGEIEEYVFANYDKLTVDELVVACENIDQQYDGVSTPYYWVYPIVNSSGYYVSYATSMIASMEYYYRGKEDLEACKNNYLAFVKYDGDKNSITNWEKGNIYSPFDERAYQYLANNLLKSS